MQQNQSLTVQADASALQEILARTSFGAIKAVIGSDHNFQIKTQKKITIANAKDKDGKPKEMTIDVPEMRVRRVRSIHQYAHFPKRWFALGTDLSADTEEELLTAIYAIHGGPEAMRKAAKRIVYCAESLSEIDVFLIVDGKPIATREILLLSDREPG